MGTLVIDEELWQKWYGHYEPADFIPRMETAHSAAQKLVEENTHVHYGCPLCLARYNSLEEAQEHTADEMQRQLLMFQMEKD